MREHREVEGPCVPGAQLPYKTESPDRVDAEITWYTEWINEPGVQDEDCDNRQ